MAGPVMKHYSRILQKQSRDGKARLPAPAESSMIARVVLARKKDLDKAVADMTGVSDLSFVRHLPFLYLDRFPAVGPGNEDVLPPEAAFPHHLNRVLQPAKLSFGIVGAE